MLESGNSGFPVDAAHEGLESLLAGPHMAMFPAAAKCFGQGHSCI